jgi:hypothetical protein
MGMNTAMVVLNDYVSDFPKDPGFGGRVREAILMAGSRHESCNRGFTVLPSVHADYTQVVLIGQNSIEQWAVSGSTDKETILRNLADDLGFRLVRKAERKGRAA